MLPPLYKFYPYHALFSAKGCWIAIRCDKSGMILDSFSGARDIFQRGKLAQFSLDCIGMDKEDFLKYLSNFGIQGFF